MPQAATRALPCPEETAFVDLVRTADWLSREPSRLLRNEGLSPEQYNVLRILRGSAEGLDCGDIAARMVTRDPDMTRLLDRLEKRRLIERARRQRDRRHIQARILPEGLALLARLDGPVCDVHRRQLGHLPPPRLRLLRELLDECRQVR